MNNFRVSGLIVFSSFPVVNIREVVRFNMESSDFMQDALIQSLDADNNVIRSESLSSQLSANNFAFELLPHIVRQARNMINNVNNEAPIFNQSWVEREV